MNEQEKDDDLCSQILAIPMAVKSAYCKGDIETAKNIVRFDCDDYSCEQISYTKECFKGTGLLLLFVADAMQEIVDEREATNDED